MIFVKTYHFQEPSSCTDSRRKRERDAYKGGRGYSGKFVTFYLSNKVED